MGPGSWRTPCARPLRSTRLGHLWKKRVLSFTKKSSRFPAHAGRWSGKEWKRPTSLTPSVPIASMSSPSPDLTSWSSSMPTKAPPSDALERLRAVIRGAVQGVGFRPFVHRLATELKLAGWVSNSNEGVVLEVEGSSAGLRQFLVRLGSEKPPLAVIHSLEPVFLDSVGLSGFSIRESGDSGAKTTIIQPDIATCADCLQEISHPQNRRYQYPFTN